MQTEAPLEEIISSTHAPFHIVVSKEVVGEVKLGWVAVSSGCIFTCCVEVGECVEVNVINTLRWFESQVVEGGVNILSESTGANRSHHSL